MYFTSDTLRGGSYIQGWRTRDVVDTPEAGGREENLAGVLRRESNARDCDGAPFSRRGRDRGIDHARFCKGGVD